MSAAWVLMLGLAAGYLANKRMALGSSLEFAEREINSTTQADPHLPSQHIRGVQRQPNLDRYENMNTQDVTPQQLERLAVNGDRIQSEAAEYERHGTRQIIGEWFSMDRGETL